MWGREKVWLARAPVEQVGGRGEIFGPPSRGHGGVEKEGSDSIVESTEDALCLPILLGSIGECEAKKRAMGS